MEELDREIGAEVVLHINKLSLNGGPGIVSGISRAFFNIYYGSGIHVGTHGDISWKCFVNKSRNSRTDT